MGDGAEENGLMARRTTDSSPEDAVDPEAMPEDVPLSHSPCLDEEETMEEEDRLVIVSSPASPLLTKAEQPKNGFHRLPSALGSETLTPPPGDTTEPSSNESSQPQHRLNGQLNKSEAEKIREYLGRSDTAVIFPEPVDIAEPKRDTENVAPADRSVAAAPGLHRCPKCSLPLASEAELVEHTRREHPPAEGATVCEPAAAATNDGDSTERHVCGKCKAVFSERAHLERHHAGHAAANNQSCQRCNKPFANVYRLQRHMLSHDESSVLRKFKCPECGKAFKFKHHLKEHIRIHSGEKPFACPNCGKRFSHSGSYSSHMTSKKCLVVNLKVRKIDVKSSRGRSGLPNSSNGQHSSNNTNSSSNNNTSNNNNAFRPIIPKYGASPDSAVAPSGGGATYLADRFPFPGLGENPPPASLQPFLPSYASVNFHSLLASHFQSLPPYVPFSGLTDMAGLLQQGLHASSPCKEDNLSYPASPGVPRQDVSSCKDSPFDEVQPHPLGTALNDVKKILQIVDATVSKQQLENRNGLSPSSSPPAYENGDDRSASPATDCRKVNGDTRFPPSRCRFCEDTFESKIDLHQHERYLCKMNRDVASSVRPVKQEEDEDAAEVQNGHAWTPPRRLLAVEDRNGGATPDHQTEFKPNCEDLKALLNHHPRPKKGELLKATREMGYPMKAIQGWFHRSRRSEDPRRTPSPSLQVPVFKPYAPYEAVKIPSAHLGSPVKKDGSPSPAGACPVDQPLDLSVKSNAKAVLTLPFTADGALNLSHKSSRLMAKGEKASEEEEEESTKRWSSPLPLLTSRAAVPDSLVDSVALRLQRNGFLSHPAFHQALGGGGGRASLSPADSESHSTSDSVRDFLPEYHPKYLHGNPVLALGGGGGGVPLVVQRSPDHRFPYPEEPRPGSSSDPASCSPRESVSPELGHHPADLLMHVKEPLLGGDYDESGPRRAFKKLWKQDDPEDGPMNSLHQTGSDEGCVTSGDLLDELHGVSGAKRRKPWKPAVSATPVAPCKLEADEGLYSCDQCDKTFSKQSSLARHKYEHSGQRPHKCDVCSKAFKHKHHLTEHKRLHSGEKPFQCQKCLKRFSHSGSYSQHMNHRYSYCKPYRE